VPAETEPRYSRLARYAPLGAVLPRWQAACCAVAGLGGLGGGLALQLTRLGVRRLLLIDRDTVGEENLGHQALFTEQHARERWPKVEAAAAVVRAVNSAVAAVPLAANLDHRNIRELLSGADIIFDGLDNYAARFLLNDYAVATGAPYFHAGVVRGELSVMAIVPGVTGCLRCVLDGPPPAGSAPTCAGEGLFPPLLGVANALQLDLACRYLAGTLTAADSALYSLALPDWTVRKLRLPGPRADCPCCGQRRFNYLDGLAGALGQAECAPGSASAGLAGGLDLDRAEQVLAAAGLQLARNAYCLVAEQNGRVWTLFPSGRVIQNGSGDAVELNRFLASYLGV
jgi:molybdopterin-synthase adenylyltransferase